MQFTMRDLLLPLLALPCVALAQSTTSMTTSMTSGTTTASSGFNPTTATDYLAGPTPAASNAVHYPGDYGYTYVGCYNETTWLPGGNRALEDGSMVPLPPSDCVTPRLTSDPAIEQLPHSDRLLGLLQRQFLPVLRHRIRPRMLGRSLSLHLGIADA